MVDSRQPTADPARIDALDGVRGLAILPVVLFHALLFGVPLQGAPLPEMGNPYVTAASLGWCGVDVFFVLSGFLITGILLRSKGAPHFFRNFYARRALRIFPLYYAVIVLLLFVLDRPPATGAEQASYLLYYQNVRFALFGEQHVDLARLITWSLAIEEQFYLVWPAVVWCCSRRALVRVCIAALIGAILLRLVLLAGGLHTTYFLTPCRLDTLAAGALMAIVGAPPRWVARLALVAGAVGLWATLAVAGSPFPETAPMQWFGLPAALALAIGVVALARHEGRFARACCWAPLRSLGRFSYCIYLVHFLVIDSLFAATHARLPLALQQWLLGNVPLTALLIAFGVACLLASWAIGFVSWHLFEKWFLAWKRHFPSGAARAA
jgi:peptidoglycan/LPS O-acetylase OafA/YrhL